MDGGAGTHMVRPVPGAGLTEGRNAPVIGGVQLASPVVQAALSGYSDLPMRRLARRFGAA